MAVIEQTTLSQPSSSSGALYKTPQQISQSIIQGLLRKDPTLAVELGSPLRKIVDAIAGAISDTTMDAHLNVVSYEIDQKSGDALDKFVSLFGGFARKSASLATGVVRFSSSEGIASQDYLIPRGMLVSSPGNTERGTLRYKTSTIGLLGSGASYVDVPVESELPGTLYNIEAQEIVQLESGITGVSTEVINNAPIIGGQDQEEDASLRERFKKTLFRSIAGTRDAFLGVATTNENISRAAVYTQVNRITEQVQIQNVSGVLRATFSKRYVIFGTEFVKTSDGSLTSSSDGNDEFYRRYMDYVINHIDNESWIEIQTGSEIVAGDIIEVDYDYHPDVSRSVLSDTYKNTIDLFIDGSDPEESTEVTRKLTGSTFVYNASGQLASNISSGVTSIEIIGGTDGWYKPGASQPVGTGIIGADVFTYTGKTKTHLTGVIWIGDSLSSHSKYDNVIETNNRIASFLKNQPVLTLPSTVTDEDGIIYTLGHDYDLVKDDNKIKERESWRAKDKLVWRIPNGGDANNPKLPATNKKFTIDPYSFDSLPGAVQSMIDTMNLRTVTQDSLVHKAQYIYMELNLGIIYINTTQMTTSDIDDRAKTNVSTLMSTQGFGTFIQFSDILSSIRSISLIDNARFINEDEDSTHFGIRILDSDGNATTHNGNSNYTEDFKLNDDELPVISIIRTVARAQNTFNDPAEPNP